MFRSTQHGAGIEFGVDLANGLLQFLRRLLVHAPQTCCECLHAVFGALQLSGALFQLGIDFLERLHGAFALRAGGGGAIEHLFCGLSLLVERLHLLSE